MSDNSELSEREREILLFVATGASNKEIARKLSISTNTVKVHLRNIFSKIGASSRTEAAMYAVQSGYVAAGPQSVQDQSAIHSTVVEDRSASGVKISRVVIGSFTFIAVVLVTLGLLNRYGVFSEPVANNSVMDEPKPEWLGLKSMPTPRFGMATAVYENHIYIIAGDTGGSATGVVERYDPITDSWETLALKPTPVADVNSAVVGGKIYVPGGRLASGAITDILEVYDPRLDQWSKAAALPLQLSQYALAVYEGKMYLFGGWDGEKYLANVFEYDSDQDAWQEKTPLSSARGFSTAVEVEGKIYLMGGFDGDEGLDLNEIYVPALDDGKNDPWSTGKRLPGGGRYGSGIASLTDIVFLIGGKGSDTYKSSSLGYEIETGQWQEIAPLPDGGLFYPGVVATGNHLYLFGGQTEQEGISSFSRSYQVFYITVLPFIR